MKQIYVIYEDDEIITARDTMNNAIAACMNRLSICGYTCTKFVYNDIVTLISYRDGVTLEEHTVFIEETGYKEGV